MGFLTAQCLTNFLNRKVKELLRRKSRGSRKLSTAVISETIIHELSVTVELPVNEANVHRNDTLTDSLDQINGETTMILDNSITQLKQTVSANADTAKTPEADTNKPTRDENSYTKCYDSCKVKPSSKRKFDMIRCSVCAHWFHETLCWYSER